MDKGLFEYWMKQAPLALTVGWIAWIAIRAMVKYLIDKDKAREDFFIAELEKKDNTIHEKDAEIKLLNQTLTQLTVKSNEVMDNLRRLLAKAINEKI